MKYSEFLKTIYSTIFPKPIKVGNKDLQLVKKDGLNLENIKKQTPEICLKAVKQNGFALCFVDKSIFDKE